MLSLWGQTAADEEEEDAGWWLARLPTDVGVESGSSLCLCLPPSLKIHYTPTNGDLMRTSPVDHPSCGSGETNHCLIPRSAVWQDGVEKADGADSQTFFCCSAVPSPVALLLNTGGWKGGWCSLEGRYSPWNLIYFFLKKVILPSVLQIPFQVDKIIISGRSVARLVH